MNTTVTNAFGIDSVIKRIQEALYADLCERWSLTAEPSERINGYGRIYKNPKGTTKVPEAYVGKRDYQDVFYSDNADANFFFLASDKSESEDEMVFTNDVKVIFCMDLEKCIAGSDRMDALAHRDAVDLLRNNPFSGKFNITGYETGLENVFSGFGIGSIEKDDLQPYHCFAVLIELNYRLTDKC